MKLRRSSILMMLCVLGIGVVGMAFLSSSGTAVILEAEVDVKPDTLNVERQGRWITVYIRLPVGFNVSEIDPSTILLEHLFQPEWSKVEDDVLMVKFDGSSVANYLWARLDHLGFDRYTLDLWVTGQLEDGTEFADSDEVSVMIP